MREKEQKLQDALDEKEAVKLERTRLQNEYFGKTMKMESVFFISFSFRFLSNN